jgi:formate/nitrite transporter FocA (FNT family)
VVERIVMSSAQQFVCHTSLRRIAASVATSDGTGIATSRASRGDTRMEPAKPQIVGAAILQPEPHAPEQQHAAERKRADYEEAGQRASPSSTIVYNAILKEGEEELSRTSSALFWSALAAGLAMGFSMIAQALLMAHLPEADWTPLVAKLGYGVGFVIVILGRQQLFTENTLRPILPLLQHSKHASIANVLRLWTLVLVANLIGALIIALVCAHSSAFEPDVRAAFTEIGARAMSHDVGTVVLLGIFAGWLIALIVWLLPFAEAARLWVIILITYLVGLGEFTHVVAGSVDVFTYAAMGHTSWAGVLVGYTIPTLIGNMIGGVALVTALNHAQVVSGENPVHHPSLR